MPGAPVPLSLIRREWEDYLETDRLGRIPYELAWQKLTRRRLIAVLFLGLG